ncbi:FHA domain-containing protein [Candidatus Chloroploca sp. Khr17]|uniref:FHA domain-containing protein n=1 Tax=Candidatus Chloroploca sp. Khr17 TaxID=2496869 RepID=UPI00196ABE40|nr:FHA domain-containing protein [Candidatus Chloroploca sp. Khr17]
MRIVHRLVGIGLGVSLLVSGWFMSSMILADLRAGWILVPGLITWFGVGLKLGHDLTRRQFRGSEAIRQNSEETLPAFLTLTTARRNPLEQVPMRLTVTIWQGERRLTMLLTGRHWTIGSDPGCDLSLQGVGVDPLHARLSLVGNEVMVTDLESIGGTFLGTLARRLNPGTPEIVAEDEPLFIGPEFRLALLLDVNA